MRKLHGAIAAWVTVASVMLPVLQASARPLEPDLVCYMRTPAGRIVNLTKLCKSTSVATAASPAPLGIQAANAGTQQSANRVQFSELKREIKDLGGGSWLLSGEVSIQTQQPIGDLSLTLKIQNGAESFIQNAAIAQGMLPPGGDISFQTAVTPSDKNHRPDFHVESVQWQPISGNCAFADDIAADGSRCGERAASERPGGR